jgi:plastocyanin
MEIYFMLTHTENFIERPRLDDENIFLPSDRQNLVNMIMEYISDEIVQEHIDNFEEFHDPEKFFTKHKEYIKGLEDFIATKDGGSKFVPLPKWPGITQVPSEFNVVKRKDDGKPWDEHFPDTLANTDTDENQIPDNLEIPELCNFPVVETLYRNIQFWHSYIHGALGSVMLDGRSPAAPIFWPFHAFLVEIYDKWKTCPNVAVIDFAFDPDSLTVPNGTNVIFIFQAPFHTVKTTSASNADPITINNGGGDTDAVPQGQIKGVAINGMSGGEIEYECGIHGAGMNGKIRIS